MNRPVLYGKTLAAGVVLLAAGLIVGCAHTRPKTQPTDATQLKVSAESAKSPFAGYDHEIVQAIQARWYDLCEQGGRELKPDVKGVVVLQFDLRSDGRATNLKVVESSVDELRTLLCQKAILDPSPFRRWPDEMSRMVNQSSREIKFTFYYE